MFVLSKLRDSVRLSPSSFSRPLDEAVIDELNRKYCNKVRKTGQRSSRAE